MMCAVIREFRHEHLTVEILLGGCLATRHRTVGEGFRRFRNLLNHGHRPPRLALATLTTLFLHWPTARLIVAASRSVPAWPHCNDNVPCSEGR
ncbi:uncharacterized protein K452DRAFT_112294 [Aplosporella prunicola CBS 121167]|uniref:Uncharacterized protein n=1 Tax=Aplosporella prunicola CBS 121167 TaxID=1176127 RepID=A0A6A6AZ43_9PEZI|nr:uncharacterized protein K452DRAFT_112294 [Aplosporella prunicola CBS 121167]KAF2137212.1 hypothetical protein K452DRAFT_112294 [Aplosporella prunicola CBS 121167]